MAVQELPDRIEREARKKGRRIAMIGYFVLVVIIAAISAWRVTGQVLEQHHGGRSSEPIDCSEGIRSLVAAVDRARTVAATSTFGESEAVNLFRDSLRPEWDRRGDIQHACSASADLRNTYDAVMHLGFTEEHAVRRDAVELAAVRRKAADLVRRHMPPAGSSVPVQPNP